MHDLITRFKLHPNHSDFAVSENQRTFVDRNLTFAPSDQWFYLLNAPPRSILGPEKTKFFESPLHASDWIGQNFRNSGLHHGMALSFNLPFPDYHHGRNTLSCVPKDPASIQKYIDFMVKEIQLLADSVAPGTHVPYLHWYSDVMKLLTPSELTQLMFHIDRSFKILKLKEAKLVFELNGAPESVDRMALMAGLGFNTTCINDPTDYLAVGALSPLLEWIDILHSFNIKSIYVRVEVPQINDTVLTNLQRLVHYLPTGILLSKEKYSKDHKELAGLKKVRQLLTKANYRSVRSNFFVCREMSKQPMTHCMKGMGLSAVSFTEKFKISNTSKLDDYYSRLSSGQLPIQSVTALHCEI